MDRTRCLVCLYRICVLCYSKALCFDRRILPVIIRSTIGVVAVSSRKYIDWMYALHRKVLSLSVQLSYLDRAFETGTPPCSPGQFSSGSATCPSSSIAGIQISAATVPTRLTSSESFYWHPFSVPVFFCLRSFPFSGLQASSTNGRMLVCSLALC